MRLLRRTRRRITYAAIIASITGGGITALTNNELAQKIDQISRKQFGLNINTAEAGQMLNDTLNTSYAKACQTLAEFGVVPAQIVQFIENEMINFSENMQDSLPDGKDMEKKIQDAVNETANKESVEKELENIVNGENK